MAEFQADGGGWEEGLSLVGRSRSKSGRESLEWKKQRSTLSHQLGSKQVWQLWDAWWRLVLKFQERQKEQRWAMRNA